MIRRNQNKKFVKLEGGKIVKAPHVVEGDLLDWGDAQLKSNGLIEVAIDHNPETESIDLANPVIVGDTVTYNKTTLSPEAVLTRAKELKRRELVRMRNNAITTQYSIEEAMLAALGILSANKKQEIVDYYNSQITNFQNKVAALNAATTLSEVKAITY